MSAPPLRISFSSNWEAIQLSLVWTSNPPACSFGNTVDAANTSKGVKTA